MARNSILYVRHQQLGFKIDGDTWNDMPIPWSYNTCAHDEVVAVRTRAGLYDVSALNVVNVNGPVAEVVLDRLVAKDITKLSAGYLPPATSTYSTNSLRFVLAANVCSSS